MSNPDIWEKRLHSWSPRRPSDAVAKRIFEGGACESKQCARSRNVWFANAGYHLALWNWVTPVAACCLTVVVLCSGSSRRATQYEPRDHATYFATLMLNATSSNVSSQTFSLSKADENIEWNVWPHATLRTTNYGGARDAMRPTNIDAQQELRPVSNSINGIYP